MAIGGCVKQYDTYGYVSANQLFMVLASGLQINAYLTYPFCPHP